MLSVNIDCSLLLNCAAKIQDQKVLLQNLSNYHQDETKKSLDLQHKLDRYKFYFNEQRSHASLDALTPIEKSDYSHSNNINLDQLPNSYFRFKHRLFRYLLSNYLNNN